MSRNKRSGFTLESDEEFKENAKNTFSIDSTSAVVVIDMSSSTHEALNMTAGGAEKSVDIAQTVNSTEVALLGDVDGNGEVGLEDALALLEISVAKSGADTSDLVEDFAIVGNVDGSDVSSPSDYQGIGLEDALAVLEVSVSHGNVTLWAVEE